MASFRETWYPHAVGAMIALRGEGGVATSGERLPLTQALDTLAIIAQFPAPLANAIRSFQNTAADGFIIGASPLADKVINATLVWPDGTTRDLDVSMLAAGKFDSVTVEEYLAGFPDVSAPWLRSPATSDEFYSIWIPSGRGAETHLLALHREAVRAWSDAVAVATDMLNDYGANIQATMSDWRNQRFWTSIRQLCTALDVIAANPPATNREKITGAVKVALERSGDVAGRGAAHIADAVGRTAAAAAGGFFDDVSLTAVAVAGLAVFIYIR